MGSKTFKVEGKNDFLKTQEVEQLRKALEEKVHVDEFDAKTCNSADLKHALMESSFLTDKKGVIIRNADKMDEDLAVGFTEDPTEGRVAVFVQSNQPGSRVKKWFKELDADKTIEVSKPKHWEIPDWIRTHGQEMGLVISEQLAEMIQEYTGEELYVIHNELHKMAIYTDGGTITQEDALDILARHDEISVFSICEQWGLCERDKAIETIHVFRKMGGSDVGLLHALLNHVEKLFLARSLYDQGDRDGTEIQSELGIPPFIWRNKVRPQVKSRQQDEWADAQEAILEVDGRVKRGENSWPLLELFLFEY